jgi:hypothetical protein
MADIKPVKRWWEYLWIAFVAVGIVALFAYFFLEAFIG